MTRRTGGQRSIWKLLTGCLALAIGVGLYVFAAPGKATATATRGRSNITTHVKVAKYGELDCNGDSPIQHAVRRSMNCTDIRGFAGVDNANAWNNRFYDNGVYIGHDEPDMTFNSTTAGSGNNVTWNQTIGKDPSAAPTTRSPGHDVTHWFQLSPAPWFSMAMCDSNSYPQLPCTAESDSNAAAGRYPGSGSAFMEMQFYPPGEPPWVDSASCDDTHWCAALTIDSLECTLNFAQCNTGCEEPVNFAFIQTNGVPAGPPSPQLSDLASSTPNKYTLLMNPGDKVSVHMWDALVPGGGGAKAFKVTVDDLSTHQTGSMQASAKNGFQNTSIVNCAGTPYNFQPEYNTAKRANIVPWAALQTNISTEFETGHFEGCTSLTKPFTFSADGVTQKSYDECHGAYENAGPADSTTPETGDAFCYYKGDTHGALNSAPDTATGCQDNVFQNGDLDFDGEPYYADWPTGTSPTSTWAGSFAQAPPLTNGNKYSRYFFQTDVALSESTCSATGGCTVPPKGPGHFYPYWSEARTAGGCVIEFGNVASGTNLTDYGKDAQYGTNQLSRLGYPEFEGPSRANTCPAPSS